MSNRTRNGAPFAAELLDPRGASFTPPALSARSP